jgi:hypothetical protein
MPKSKGMRMADLQCSGIPAMGIMLGTIVIKGLVWVWLRSVKNSSVEALAGDAATGTVPTWHEVRKHTDD